MNKYGLKFHKSLGQNFLIEKSFLEKIIASAQIGKEDDIIEIGPGLGSLTQLLAENAKFVHAIEIDQRLVAVLNKIFEPYNNVKIVHGDALSVDYNSFVTDNSKVVANLPYYITTPIIMNLLEGNVPLKSITVMVQKEVAERMVATPGGKEYGALSCAVQYHSEAKLVCKVPKNVFIPSPKVESAVVTLKIRENKAVDVAPKAFFRVIKASFGQRRKTLVNALKGSGSYSMSKDEILDVIREMGLNDMIRGEQLGIEEFAVLAGKLS